MKKRELTVRSAYHVVNEWIQPSNNGPLSSFHANSYFKLWHRVWDANVAPKVKVCIWRLCNNFVPTIANLARRHIDTNTCSVMCNSYSETVIPLLNERPYAKRAWLASHLGFFF